MSQITQSNTTYVHCYYQGTNICGLIFESIQEGFYIYVNNRVNKISLGNKTSSLIRHRQILDNI